MAISDTLNRRIRARPDEVEDEDEEFYSEEQSALEEESDGESSGQPSEVDDDSEGSLGEQSDMVCFELQTPYKHPLLTCIPVRSRRLRTKRQRRRQ